MVVDASDRRNSEARLQLRRFINSNPDSNTGERKCPHYLNGPHSDGVFPYSCPRKCPGLNALEGIFNKVKVILLITLFLDRTSRIANLYIYLSGNEKRVRMWPIMKNLRLGKGETCKAVTLPK